LTGYFVNEPSFKVVQTEGDNKRGQFVPGRITRIFDRLEVVPWRFFENPQQEIRRDADGNDSLWVSMKLKKNPFEEAGHSYNEKSTGAALDDIYKKRDEKWLPVLRFFWYLEDPNFLAAYRSLSGEIRAHSLLLPLQNPWIYNQNRIGFRPCVNNSHRHGYDNVDQFDPCCMAEMANKIQGCDSDYDKLKRCWDRYKKDVRVWGNFIYDQADYESDGNAGAFNLNRNGVVFGLDKPTPDGKQYVGIQFAIARGEIDAFLSEAKVDDFNFGIYHGKKIHNVFQWRNYLGMGIESYEMRRELISGLAYYDWVWDTPDGLPSTNPADGHYQYSNEIFDGKLRSDFNGYTFYANTEVARPIILGTCNQYMIRPFAALDVISTWQNAAAENGNFKSAEYVRLDFLSANHVRAYGRHGISFERNGNKLNWHAGLSHNVQLGGRKYASVDNKFQANGKNFNIRSVNTGNNFLNLNCGMEWYIGKKRNQFVMINYQAMFGKNINAQSTQLGYQYKF
jgi:outer membrane autotransporter protein